MAPGLQVWPHPAHTSACSWQGLLTGLWQVHSTQGHSEAMQQWDVERWGSAHLGDDGEVVAQVMEANRCNVHIVNDDLPSSRLQHPEQAIGEGGFSSPGPAHNPNLWKQLFRLADRAVETGQMLSILV